MSEFQVRTDLALEARERFEEDVEIRGVAVEESYDERRDIRVTVVRIQTENGAKAWESPSVPTLHWKRPGCRSQTRIITGRCRRSWQNI